MQGAVVRFALVLGLFLCWLGYLAYLVVFTPRDPVILCRPQFLVSDLDAIAQVDDPNQPVTVVEVNFPKGEDGARFIDQRIEVRNIAECAPPAHLQKKVGQKDFTAPGLYILALRATAEKDGNKPVYEVVPTPPAPGYPAPGTPRLGPPRIYPATAEARAQLRRIEKP